MNSEIISRENISTDKLQELFNAAFIDFSIQDDLILIQERWKIFVLVDEGKRFIQFMVIFNDADAKHSDRLEVLNKINQKIIGLSASEYDSSSIAFQYFLWTEGGVTSKNIILCFRAFKSMVEGALEELNLIE